MRAGKVLVPRLSSAILREAASDPVNARQQPIPHDARPARIAGEANRIYVIVAWPLNARHMHAVPGSKLDRMTAKRSRLPHSRSYIRA